MSLSPSLPLDGMLLADKPADWTSHDVVSCIKRRFHLAKVGHCGTLDPFATGLLIVLFGRACKCQDSFMAQDKVYSGTIRLGVETDSGDRTGTVTCESDCSGLESSAVAAAMATFVGSGTQIPPMTSAIKVNGRPLYKLARQGLEIERAPRPVVIHAFRLTAYRLPEVDFEVLCSKGTYVRTLAADLGRQLGCGGHLLELRRLRSGSRSVADAWPLAAIKAWETEELLAHMTPWPFAEDV